MRSRIALHTYFVMGTKTTAAVAAVMLLGTFAIYSTYLEQSSVLSTWKTAAPMKPADRVEAQASFPLTCDPTPAMGGA